MSFKILGVNDDKDFCQCCGKDSLKSVVWIENLETGEVQHFGSTCATKPAKAFGITKSDITKTIRQQEKAEAARLKEVEREAFYQAHKKAEALRIKTDYAYMAVGGTFNKLSGKPHNVDKWNKIKEELQAA
jgi:hypothetical protein